jgi:hypothetical protein
LQVLTLSYNHFLDNFVLNAEFSKACNISGNAYKFWKNGVAGRFEGSRTIFLQKETLPKKYQKNLIKCSSLAGLVTSKAFCSFTGLANSHLVKSNGSKMYEYLDIKTINGIKFVNLRKFYDDLGLSYEYHIYIEKCHFFAPEPLERKIKITDTLCVGYY